MKEVKQATYQEESEELDDLWSSIPSELGIVQTTNLHAITDILSIYQNNTTSLLEKPS